MVTVIFSKSHTPGSWLIRYILGSPFSHCAISFRIFGVPVVMQATLGGVLILPRSRFKAHNTIVEEYKFKQDMSAELATAIDKYLGIHYDYAALLGFLYVKGALRWLRHKVKNPLASPSAVVCSEFVVDFANGKVPSWQDFDSETTDPLQLQQQCSSEYFERVTGFEGLFHGDDANSGASR